MNPKYSKLLTVFMQMVTALAALWAAIVSSKSSAKLDVSHIYQQDTRGVVEQIRSDHGEAWKQSGEEYKVILKQVAATTKP